MIYKCPNCNGALEYNPVTDEMECAYCGNDYVVWELENATVEPSYDNVDLKGDVNEYVDFTKQRTIYDEPELMECKIYTCTSCGAELAVSNTEVSTYCAYCGQPTVVFSRVSKEMQPDYIIPFSVTREQAFHIVRQRFAKGSMVPKEIKHFQIEKMRGIYIPYFIYDIDYRDTQGLEKPGGKNSPTEYFIRKAEVEFKGILHDASKQLNDESAVRLEPYDLSALRPFEPQYLSGFYADKYDLSQQEVKENGVKRAKDFFDSEIEKSVNRGNLRLRHSKPSYAIQQIQYAMLPAWFITFRYKNEPYTILVNGQTGKMVGTVPVNMGSMWKTFILSWLGFTALLIPISPLLGGTLTTWIGILLVVKAYMDYKKIRKSMELTKEWSTVRYVKERQDGT